MLNTHFWYLINETFHSIRDFVFFVFCKSMNRKELAFHLVSQVAVSLHFKIL